MTTANRETRIIRTLLCAAVLFCAGMFSATHINALSPLSMDTYPVVKIVDGSNADTFTVKDGSDVIITGYEDVSLGESLVITSALGGEHIEIDAPCTASSPLKLTLDNVKASASVDVSAMSTAPGSKVELTLVGDNELVGGGVGTVGAGIEVPVGASLSISGDGSLFASGLSANTAGIGGGAENETLGSGGGAGVGGGEGLDGSALFYTQNGGSGGDAGTLAMNGGKLYAYGGARGDGVGPGRGGIAATGGTDGATGAAGTVAVTVGELYSVGYGADGHGIHVSPSTLAVSGGVVEATALGAGQAVYTGGSAAGFTVSNIAEGYIGDSKATSVLKPASYITANFNSAAVRYIRLATQTAPPPATSSGRANPKTSAA